MPIDKTDNVEEQATLSDTEAAKRETVTTDSPDAVTLYANNAGFVLTPWDVMFTFGQIREASKQRLSLVTLAKVYMSPQHAKAFLAALTKNVAAYEAKFGQIAPFEVVVEKKQSSTVVPPIGVSFEDAVKALLRTPPPPAGDPSTRKKKPARKSKRARK